MLMYRFLCVINMLLFIFCFFLLMNRKGYVYKFKINIQFIVTLILIIVFAIKGIPFGRVSFIILITSIFLLYLICKVLYQRNAKESIISSVSYSLVYILIECSIYWFLYITISFNYESIYIYVLNLGINTLVIFLSIYFFDKLKEFYNDRKYFLYISLIIIVNILVILLLNLSTVKINELYNILINNNVQYNNIIYMVNISVFMQYILPYIVLIINMILIFIFINSVKSEQEKVKLKFMNEKLDMQYKYYLMVKESQEKMKQVYHDMNNHIENIKVLKNSSEDVNRYIKNIEDEVKSNENIYNTGNVLLDIILYEKSKNCAVNNIDFNIGIDFGKFEFIELIDISSIFSNLIDNAIEACNKIDDNEIKKYITIKSTFIKGYYVVRCENSKTNKVVTKNNKILTSKKDTFLHGVGLESIESSIKQYNGELKIKDSEYKFTVTIYLPIE